MPVIAVGKPLREKLGDDGSEALVQLFNDSQKEQKADVIEFVGEKFERRLSEDIGSLEVRLSEKMADLEVRLSGKMADLEVRLTEKITAVDNKISDTKSELIKWMFIFWIGQVGMLIGILFAFFKR